MVEQIGSLLRLGRGIDGAQRGAGFERGENADDRLPAILHEQDDAVPGLHAAARQRHGQTIRQRVEIAIAEPLAPGHQRDLVGKALGAVLKEPLYPHRSPALVSRMLAAYAARVSVASLR